LPIFTESYTPPDLKTPNLILLLKVVFYSAQKNKNTPKEHSAMSKQNLTVSPTPSQATDQKNRVIAVVAAALTTPEAASYLNIKPATLCQWRWNGRGPKFCKIGRSVRYMPHHLDEFLSENVFTSTTDAQSAV
jgi:hypothetical protein